MSQSSMPQKVVSRAPAGAEWHTLNRRSNSEEKSLSPRSTHTMILQAPQPLALPKKPSSLASKAASMKLKPKSKRKSTLPIGRRTWRDITAGDAVDYGWKAWNLAKKISTLINVEEKVWDVDGSGGTTITSTPTVVNLSNIAQGTDYFNRIGDSILVQSMEFRAEVEGNAAAANHSLRVLLVADRYQDGVDPSLGDVLQAGTSPLVQPYNVFTRQRFSILYDQLIEINNVVGLATSGTSSSYYGLRMDIPDMARKWNKHIKFDASAGADASNRENALFLMAVSSNASNGPALKYTFRLTFTDN